MATTNALWCDRLEFGYRGVIFALANTHQHPRGCQILDDGEPHSGVGVELLHGRRDDGDPEPRGTLLEHFLDRSHAVVGLAEARLWKPVRVASGSPDYRQSGRSMGIRAGTRSSANPPAVPPRDRPRAGTRRGE